MSRHPDDARRVGAPTSPQWVGVRGADLRDRPPLEGATLAHRPRVQPHAEGARRRLPPAAFGTNPIADPDQESPWALEVRVTNRVQDDPPGASPDPAPGVWAPALAIAPAELRRTPLSPLITRRLRTSG